ncbi:hypothetical protein AVEN_120788-1 [Araneus ventricosus]|uniref:Integrase catalytic domain-containing protein n=1 Tax=Araneus ventricosus TaxID=182803 RepID=A0A4Y2WI48_ARAVE|nr:hypothetical protein AVEN_190649-1 [Araneus ventricosus]GBO36030.1 hypothetical protein AVEN_245951-1 [Araneus ventricosus]GBO36034.1 hypothetical protein AVEN_120788-1 [Araneus ventricosus]
MRIVFDASSSHSFQHLSLNDCLWPGPNLNSNIFDILIKFRLNKFAFISDIEKAFLQLTLAEKDRDAVRFLSTENDTLQVHRFNRVLFGVRSSPFLLSASIKTHLKKFHDEFPTTTECLNRCFYVDDFISGADSLQDALEISTQAVSIMDQASMVLRKWTTNSDELRQLWIREGLENQLQDNPISPRANSTKVLGMLWNTVEDYLILGTQSLVDSLSNNENTKRHLLRAIGNIFDPLGLLSPFIIRVKCILQVLWMKEISWDEELPPDIQKKWCQWVSEVPRLSELQVPRYVLSASTGEPTDVLELHCFCDASQKAYGVVIYTRVVKDCNVEVNLLVSKSRVAPLTKITMPRLELLGALLAARLASKVKAIVDLKRPSKVFFWTDSKITLQWIEFIHNVKNIERLAGHLAIKELQRAEIYLVQLVQQGEFAEEIKNFRKGATVPSNSKVKSLNCFLDESGILRVGGRLIYSDLSLDEKHPIVLPDKHPLTLIIVRYYHLKYLHVGSNALLYHIRRKFWIINGRNVCLKVVFQYITCFKNKPVLERQIMGDLPRERVTPSFPFCYVGIDFCGPFHIKFKNQRKGILNKVYVCIFVCLSTKAIHLDFVSDLTSDAFIACLKRFFSRRGKSSKIFSDNAKNFVGASTELKKLYKMVSHPNETLANFLLSENNEWKFIPPRSPNFGGLWEAGVKSFKHHLKRVVGNAHLTLEEFLTIILEIESVLNSRPLTPLSTEFDNFETLSPGHFLIGRPLTSIVEPDLLNISENRLSK